MTTTKTDTYTSKYSDAQKIKFAQEETNVTTILGRKNEGIIAVGDYLFGVYPENYIKVCNKFFNGSVKVVSC